MKNKSNSPFFHKNFLESMRRAKIQGIIEAIDYLANSNNENIKEGKLLRRKNMNLFENIKKETTDW